MRETDEVVLPLYSTRSFMGEVLPRSGLNQWNADGRPRDLDEVYIPVPAQVNNMYPTFFPERNVPFILQLPSGQCLSAKMCQDGRKALMSKPNSALGRWILRDVLKVKRGIVISMRMLHEIGIDSVTIRKVREGFYTISASPEVHYSR